MVTNPTQSTQLIRHIKPNPGPTDCKNNMHKITMMLKYLLLPTVAFPTIDSSLALVLKYNGTGTNLIA